MKNLIIFALTIFLSSNKTDIYPTIEKNSKASTIKQSTTDAPDVLFSCAYTKSVGPDDCIPDNFGAFTTNTISIAVVLKKIMDVVNGDTSTKVSANFIPFECTFPEPVFKALTKKSDTTRYILYTKKQLDELMRTNTDWVAFSIFAHEIGHHLYLHSLSNPKDLEESRKREIEADFFSGFVLHKLHATVTEAQSGINAFNNHPPDSLEAWCTHPTKAKRLLAVRTGYNYVDEPDATTKHLLDINELQKKLGKEQIFNKTMEMIYTKRFDEAVAYISELVKQIDLQKIKYRADILNNIGFIKKEAGDISGSIIDFNKAIDINNSNADYYLNRAETKKASPQKVLQAESREDYKIATEIKKYESATKGQVVM